MGFAELVNRSIADNDVSYLEKLPIGLLGDNEKALVNYIVGYYHEWGDGEICPSSEAIAKNVPIAKYFLSDTLSSKPLENLYVEAKRKLVTKKLNEEIVSAKHKHDDGSLDVESFAKDITNIYALAKPSTIQDIDCASDIIYRPPTNKYYFPYETVQKASDGLLGTELCLIVARPKVGKTFVALDCAISGVRDGLKVYFNSGEMGLNQIAHRVHAMVGGFNSKVFRGESRESLLECKKKYDKNKVDWLENGGKFLIPSKSPMRIGEVLDEIRKVKPDVAFLDSVYGFHGDNGKPIGDDWGAIQSAVSTLKNIAMELDIPVICTTQLKRGSGGGATDISDISFSDSFGQFSDLIINLYNTMHNGKNKIALNFLAARHVDPNAQCLLDPDFDTMSIKEYKAPLMKAYSPSVGD